VHVVVNQGLIFVSLHGTVRAHQALLGQSLMSKAVGENGSDNGSSVKFG
jgi:hypothetical protein